VIKYIYKILAQIQQEHYLKTFGTGSGMSSRSYELPDASDSSQDIGSDDEHSPITAGIQLQAKKPQSYSGVQSQVPDPQIHVHMPQNQYRAYEPAKENQPRRLSQSSSVVIDGRDNHLLQPKIEAVSELSVVRPTLGDYQVL